MPNTPLRQLRLVKTADVYKAGEPAGVIHRLPDRTEFLFRAAAHTRLRLATVELVHDKLGAPGLLVHRFDRIPQGGHLRPLAVEDACQVLGRWPGDKYVILTEDAIAGLARCCRAPGVAALELYRLLVFAYLSGNGDLHAKNLSIEDLNQLPYGANIIRNLHRLIRARIRHIQPEQ